MDKRLNLILLLIIPILAIPYFLNSKQQQIKNNPSLEISSSQNKTTPDPNATLFIETLKKRSYQANEIKIEQTLTPGINYQRYIASYESDGLKIYGLFTIPNNNKPQNGFPLIVFLHGYLDPKTYQTTDRYVAYQDGFAKNGFITFKPDLRGHGRSEGNPVNTHFSQEYVIDTLNLIAALKIYKDANPNLLGLWGHSNGGEITLRTLIISPDIKAAVIWAGVVGSYEDMLVVYRSKITWLNNREDFIQEYGQPNLTAPFWSQIDPYNFIQSISAPVQLHHGTADDSVPIELSRHLKDTLTKKGKIVELYEYPGGDHNLSAPAFSTAMERSVNFFKKYLQ